jgi:glycosyltransferase involved in cell wall biosynthesis
VFHVNADQSASVIEMLGAEFLEGKLNVGYWAWELSEFPDRWNTSFKPFDEIWTPSRFCQESISRKSPVPVIRMPHAIQPQTFGQLDRVSFSIPSDRFIFLAVFDLLSVVERKNPLGVIEAFAKAFEGSTRCHLVLKVNHASHRPAEMSKIANATTDLPITIIDRTIERDHLNSLIQCCDCLVSLHRSEGFGLTLAEAMYLKKPVIGTAYSGNMDFMRHDNSFLVGYDLVTVPAGCDPYDEGMMWASPRLSEAIEQMRVVAGNSTERSARATRGQECIQREFSPEVIGRVMLNRLERIYSNHAQALISSRTLMPHV